MPIRDDMVVTPYSGICSLTTLEHFIKQVKTEFSVDEGFIESDDGDVRAKHYSMHDKSKRFIASIMAVRLGVVITQYVLKKNRDVSVDSIDDFDEDVAPQLYEISLLASDNVRLKEFIENITAAKAAIGNL